MGENLEARGGIEPPHRAFAELGLTTWLPRRSQGEADVANNPGGVQVRKTISLTVVSHPAQAEEGEGVKEGEESDVGSGGCESPFW